MLFNEENKKILVISTNIAERNLIVKELESGFFDIKEASNAENALKLVDEFNPNLIILDSDLPDMDSLELSKKIIFSNNLDKNTRNIQIVFLTQNDNIDQKLSTFEAGISTFLSRPFFDGEILNLVEFIFNSDSHLQGLNTLLVDNCPLARHAVSTALKQQNISLTEAKNASSALEQIKNPNNNFELFILDFILPDINGDKLCEQIRRIEKYKNVPIIFLSELREKNPVVDIFKSGATDYLIKPFNNQELIYRIKIHIKAKNTINELNNRIISLKQINKLKDEFYNVTSNDFNVPIEIIEYESKKIIDLDDPSIFKLSGQKIYACTTLLNNLARNVDELTRLYSGKVKLEMEDLYVSQLLNTMIEKTQKLANLKDIKISINIKKEESKINGDIAALKQIFQNIFSNAIKFNRIGGSIEIIIEEKPVEILVFIKDTGIGIPNEILSKLYNKFSKYTTQGTSGEQGTGLGISIIKELMIRHKGSIDIHSEKNIGTTFQLCFPKI